MFRIGKVLLDNDDLLVTAGLLGSIKVTLKSRGLTYKANRFERTKLLDTLDELKKRGYFVEPNSKEFEEVITHFSEALLGRGDARWQAYFIHSSTEDLVSDVVGVNNNSENHKDFQRDSMDEIDETLENLTQEEWERLLDETAAQEIQDAHKLYSEKSNNSGIYTRYALKKDIQKYTKEHENHLEDGSINWKYVSADAMIVYGDEMDTDTIYKTLEEVAQDIDPKKINYIKQLKKSSLTESNK